MVIVIVIIAIVVLELVVEVAFVIISATPLTHSQHQV
jgi:hypothetical protein